MRGLVSRFTHIHYSGYDASGKPVNVTAEGFHARVVQHECDHLDGIIYTQRLSDPLKFGFIEELINSGQLATTQCSE
jgi:peptide deformylase